MFFGRIISNRKNTENSRHSIPTNQPKFFSEMLEHQLTNMFIQPNNQPTQGPIEHQHEAISQTAAISFHRGSEKGNFDEFFPKPAGVAKLSKPKMTADAAVEIKARIWGIFL